MNDKIIGIDIGGTKIRGILWNGKEVLKTQEIITPINLESFKLELNNLIKFLSQTNKIAIGASGVVKGSKLIESTNIPYIKNFDFTTLETISSDWKMLDNDARCFARAEYEINNTYNIENIFYITIGTGIGRAVVNNGEILKIKKFEYFESWEKNYQKIRDNEDNKALAKYLNEKILELVKPYNIQKVVVGGGMLNKPDFWSEFKNVSNLPIEKSKLGENAVAIGATMLFNN